MAIDGTYNIEIDTPMGKQEGKLSFKTAGAVLTGTMENAMGKNDFTGAVKGNDVSWSSEISSPMGSMKLDFKAKIDGINITGEVQAGSFGSSPFKGKKV